MSARLGFSLRALRRLHPAACDTDARLVWKDGDRLNIGIVQPRYEGESWDRYFVQVIAMCGPRELRLLGLQMIRHAENLEHDDDDIEVVLP